MIELKGPRELAAMAEAGEIVAEVLATLAREACPGMRTRELDARAATIMKRRGGAPAFKGYRGFPAHICTSVNEEVVHGIPGDRILREGDLLSVDAGVQVRGYYGDAAVTIGIGRVSERSERLCRVAEEALHRGIAQAQPNQRVSDISHAVQAFVEAQGFGVVRQFVGHGIGSQLHQEPEVPNFATRPGYGPRLSVGMVLAIEPMVTAGGPEVEILPDGWTVVTKDRGWAAHFEHSVSITAQGPEILTTCRRKMPLR